MPKKRDGFEEFLIKEYENIAAAHFESQKQFALFFRYYTLFFSIPIILVGLTDINDLTHKWALFLGFLMTVLSIIGFFFYLYTIDLKNESILYARTVNGLRNYYYSLVPKSIIDKVIVLPIDRSKPKYFNPLSPVYVIIKIVNSVFLGTGLYLIIGELSLCLILSSIVFFGLHVGWNYIKCQKQEASYGTSID